MNAEQFNLLLEEIKALRMAIMSVTERGLESRLNGTEKKITPVERQRELDELQEYRNKKKHRLPNLQPR